MNFRIGVLHLIFALSLVENSKALYLSDKLETKKSWEFIGRFCFLSELGVLDFTIRYPTDHCCHNILFYKGGQWEKVYKNDSKSCNEKESILQDRQVTILTTQEEWSGCQIINITNETFYECRGGRSFRTRREKWWYIAISNCKNSVEKSEMGLNITYSMSLTNGDTFFTKHFSADEFGIMETYIVFLLLFVILLTCALKNATLLAYRQLLHATYKIFLLCIVLEVFGTFIVCVALGKLASTGIENSGFKIIGQLMGATSEVIFLLLLLLLGKGYTVTRGQLSHSGSVKLTMFSTIYFVIAAVLFFYEYVLFDPGKVLYVYESPAGYGLIALRLSGWLWFSYGVIFTLKHYPEKTQFYYPFYVFYSLWFFAVPIMVIAATFSIPRYMRSKIVTILELVIDFLAYAGFLILTRPQQANTNFPYHVRTSQIGVVGVNNNAGKPTNNFPHSIYGVTEESENGNHFADLFLAKQQAANYNTSGKKNAHNVEHIVMRDESARNKIETSKAN